VRAPLFFDFFNTIHRNWRFAVGRGFEGTLLLSVRQEAGAFQPVEVRPE
jgi:hypothetical protein